MRSADATPPWMPDATTPEHQHAGLLAGATATGEAARQDHSVRVGVWLDDQGRVRKARWRASSDRGLRVCAETACAQLEAGTDAATMASALVGATGHPDRAELVALAVEAALHVGRAR